MITGAHVIVYSANAEADQAFLRDVLGFPHVDTGHGGLIFGLPPAECMVHQAEANGRHDLYLMCDDVEAEIRRLGAVGIVCAPVQELRWGRLTSLRLPGGGDLGLYQPLHPRP